MDRHEFLRAQRWLAESPGAGGPVLFRGCASLHLSLSEQQPGRRERRGARAHDAVHLSFAVQSALANGAELDPFQMEAEVRLLGQDAAGCSPSADKPVPGDGLEVTLDGRPFVLLPDQVRHVVLSPDVADEAHWGGDKLAPAGYQVASVEASGHSYITAITDHVSLNIYQSSKAASTAEEKQTGTRSLTSLAGTLLSAAAAAKEQGSAPARDHDENVAMQSQGSTCPECQGAAGATFASGQAVGEAKASGECRSCAIRVAHELWVSSSQSMAHSINSRPLQDQALSHVARAAANMKAARSMVRLCCPSQDGGTAGARADLAGQMPGLLFGAPLAPGKRHTGELSNDQAAAFHDAVTRTTRSSVLVMLQNIAGD